MEMVPPSQDAPGRHRERRVFIKVDMEGVSGVVSPEQVVPGAPDYENARQLLMQDLEAVLGGAFAAGCNEALIYDAHRGGRNIVLQGLDQRALVISGRPLPRDGFFYGLDRSFAALFLVGYHARAGSPDALMPRTYYPEVARLRINDTEVGEIGMEAALAGHYGVPLAFVSADSAGVREARDLLGHEVQAVQVKKAITETSGVCMPAGRTARALREAAYRAVHRAPRVPPVVFGSPTRLEVDFRSAQSAAALAEAEGVERRGNLSVRTEGANVVEAYRTLVLARARNGDPHSGSSSSSASR